MALRDKCAHFDIGKRTVLLAVARDIPLDVSLLASHGTLVSLRSAGGDRRAAPWPKLAFLHGANVVREGLLRQSAALARGAFLHGGILAALLTRNAAAIRRRKSRKIQTRKEAEG
jgi:hypothetical protein